MNLAENYCNLTTYNFNWKFFCNVVDDRKPVSITVLVIVNMDDNEKSRFSPLLGIKYCNCTCNAVLNRITYKSTTFKQKDGGGGN